MSDSANSKSPAPNAAEAVDDVLRGELAQSDLVLGTVGPIIGHMLASPTNSLFSDEIVARIRGMIDHLARQILHARAEVGGQLYSRESANSETDSEAGELASKLATSEELLLHCHALAQEWQLAQRLEQSAGIDPVLTPMVQALIASNDADTASLAMAMLASQARFTQHMRRMELPLNELPGELFHLALEKWRAHTGSENTSGINEVEESLRAGFDERLSREGLMSRLLMELPGDAKAALSLSHAGVALFLSALALGAGQNRDLTVQSTDERQLARLALALRSAGLKPAEIEEQFLHIHPDVELPENFSHLRADQAAGILASSSKSDS